MAQTLSEVRDAIIHCEACPRLRRYCERIGREKRAAYRTETYWAKPVPGFGDPNARLFVVGLAPAAHGGNRTGRVFTGDRSGDWLYEALHTFGFANQPTSVHKNDGLRAIDCYIAPVVRCAPPDNKPLPKEFDKCRPYLVEEFRLLKNLKVVIALGKIAFDHYLNACRKVRSTVRSLIKKSGLGTKARQWVRSSGAAASTTPVADEATERQPASHESSSTQSRIGEVP